MSIKSFKPRKVAPPTGDALKQESHTDWSLPDFQHGVDRQDIFHVARLSYEGVIAPDIAREGKWTLTMRVRGGNTVEPEITAVGDLETPMAAFNLFTVLVSVFSDAGAMAKLS